MNILRFIGQDGLNGTDAPSRHRAKRRRIILGVGANDRAAVDFKRLYGKLISACG